MIRLLYVSNTSQYLEQGVIDGILAASRANNEKLGVTGILLHLDGAFMQVLEGEKNKIISLYEKICQDPRHWNTHVLVIREGEPVFKDWSMGFHRLDESRSDENTFAITKAALKRKIDPSTGPELLTLLKTFYKVQTNQEMVE